MPQHRGWITLEDKTEVVAEALDGNGAARFVIVPMTPPQKRIIVDHIGLHIDAQTGTDDPQPLALLYLGTVKKENFFDGTSRGDLNAASYTYGLIVPSDLFVTLDVTQGLADGQAIARVQYSIQEREH